MSEQSPQSTASSPAPRQMSWGQSAVGIVFSVIALAASAALVLTEIAHYKNPDAALSCDINPLIGCGESLTTWQAHLLFGIPNSLLGTIFFTALTTIFVLLLCRTFLPGWMWWCLAGGGVLGLALVVFFLYQSVTVFHALCPWCLVVWTSTVPVAWLLIVNALRLNLSEENALARVLYRERWLIMVGIYLLLVIAVVLGLGSRILLLF